MDEELARKGRQPSGDVLTPSQRRAGHLGVAEGKSGRRVTSLCPSGTFMVLLPRNICEGQLREDDKTRDDISRRLLRGEWVGQGQADLLAILTLNHGERLQIARRRKGWTQAKAARACGIHRNTYCDYENSKTVTYIAVPEIDVSTLVDREICYLLRRRKKWTQGDLAERVKASRFWVNQMEKGDTSCEILNNFWGI